LIKKVLKEITKEFKKELGQELVSVIVFGSAVTNHFKPKESDVDLILITKNNASKEKIKLLAERILKRISDEHGLNLFYAKSNFIADKLWGFAKNLGVHESVFVCTRKEFLDRKFFFCRSEVLASLMIPKNKVWGRIKKEGKTLLGEDLLRELRVPKPRWMDKLKCFLPSAGALSLGLVMLPFCRKKARYLLRASKKWLKQNVRG